MADEELSAVDKIDAKGAPTEEGGSPIRRLILLLAIGCASAMVGLFFAVGSDGLKSLFTGSDEISAEKEEMKEEGRYAYVNFDEMIVNISGHTTQGRKVSRFMKVKLTLVVDEAEYMSVNDRKAFIRDNFQNYMRQLDEREVAGSIGIESLKAELLKRAKAVAGNDAPKEVLIGELIIQ